MVLEVIILGVVGAAYVTGEVERKQKMRKIDSEFVDVAKITASDAVSCIRKLRDNIEEDMLFEAIGT